MAITWSSGATTWAAQGGTGSGDWLDPAYGLPALPVGGAYTFEAPTALVGTSLLVEAGSAAARAVAEVEEALTALAAITFESWQGTGSQAARDSLDSLLEVLGAGAALVELLPAAIEGLRLEVVAGTTCAVGG